jgi:hypothetical protein
MINVWYLLDHNRDVLDWSDDCEALPTRTFEKICDYFQSKLSVSIKASVKSVQRSQGDEEWTEQVYSDVSEDAKALPNELFTEIINHFYK